MIEAIMSCRSHRVGPLDPGGRSASDDRLHNWPLPRSASTTPSLFSLSHSLAHSILLLTFVHFAPP